MSQSFNILLMTNHLSQRGGTEVWTEVMYQELIKLGHSVDVQPVTGQNSIFPALSYSKDKRYDAAIVNHYTSLQWMTQNGVNNVGKIIMTTHGTLPSLERPSLGADVYVGVSEETRDYIKEVVGVNARIIRNPIQTSLFLPENDVNYKCQEVGAVGNGFRNAFLYTASLMPEDISFSFSSNENISNMNNFYNKFDLVIGAGRTALEAMSCGRNVIVAGHGGVDGFLDMDSVWEFRKFNMSGRFNRDGYDNIAKHLESYDPDLGKHLRRYVVENNEASMIAKQYLELI